MHRSKVCAWHGDVPASTARPSILPQSVERLDARLGHQAVDGLLNSAAIATGRKPRTRPRPGNSSPMADVGGAVCKRLDGLFLAAIDDDDAKFNPPAQRSPAARNQDRQRENAAFKRGRRFPRSESWRRPGPGEEERVGRICRPGATSKQRRRARLLNFSTGMAPDFQCLAWPNRACARTPSARSARTG